MSDENVKVPSQIFRWFEKMKSNYENSVQTVLSRFENYAAGQQNRLDTANQQHIDNLKFSHNNQLDQSQVTINHLHKDIEYYKLQIEKQQQTIAQLNTRYDAVMSCLLTDQNKRADIKDIFQGDDFFTEAKKELLTPKSIQPIDEQHYIEEQSSDTSSSNDQVNEFTQDPIKHPVKKEITDDVPFNSTHDDYNETGFKGEPATDNQQVANNTDDNETLFEQAVQHRTNQEFESAFTLFEQAATNQHARSMGALGRSYFLGEGIEENHEFGLAWLIKAAALELPQAISRIAHFKEHDNELYQLAVDLVESQQI